MKIAIIGSGVSGLSCAYRLNQLGIRPVIFERRSIIGEAINLCGIHLHCFNHLHNRPLQYFNRKYNLKLKPMSEVRKLTMYAGDKEVSIQGHLGYIFNRGAARTSLEYQLFSQVDAELYMDTYIPDTMIEDIAREFDSVVIATGTADIPDSLGIVDDSTPILLRGGLLEGKYETGAITTWVNTDYSGHFYVYLVSISECRSILYLLADNITSNDLDFYWKKMITTEAIQNNFLETWVGEFHSIRLKTNRLGNIYFVGNAGGMTDDFLGFGIINSIAGGIIAADAIVRGESYEKSIKPILTQVDQLHNLRLLANKMDERGWKRFISFAGMPGVRHLVYKHSLIKYQHLGALVGCFVKKK